MKRTFVHVAVQTDPDEWDFSESRAVPLGRPWPGEDEETLHIEKGYYRRYAGGLGKIKNGVKLTESEDDHSSSQSAKRARYDPDDMSSSQESVLQKSDEWNDGSQCEHHLFKPGNQPPAVEASDEEEEKECIPQYPQYAVYRCNNTFIEGEEEIRCNEETNGSSQLCHHCLQSFKRSFF